ncbi:MAG: phosphomannomutase [Candidatus Scalindua sp. AMX11]|nr:MAG: phosphomannomutase [Candidatus Scalindua sp.]NOG83410.1 phosphomannomutase [Planctomycetota bacterium]RZV75077.1 MAG: phosphomannomutase [Candidatus Scalindua sp. SCAELEC01]TDE64340.1 MAG: phosphomannomutase [Candidatus Scalindua sp. AMX11]GJQ60601.1 MAG: phosphomannomutase [Candidatus Scalindua sp.]
MKIKVQDLMISSNVKFGTSGARGRALDMTDLVCYVYAKGFLHYLESTGELKKSGTEVAIAGDYRPSTDRIIEAVRRATADMGYLPVNCGKIPSPAVALYGIVNQIPSIMVTGSHIPADRNGIKFNKPTGEILKEDEVGIREQLVRVDDNLFTEDASFTFPPVEEFAPLSTARDRYIARYLDLFPDNCLSGRRIGIYQHSAVGRDILLDIIKGLGAEAVALGRSETFVPVDTEAIRPEDLELAIKWAETGSFDAIISTDGDGDRPLIFDERGRWLRGDVAGILCARYLSADSVSVPVSCNSAVEKTGYFKSVSRTRIGSPFVIESMIDASKGGAKVVVGYEANGGFLTNSDIPLFGKRLRALPTRDAVIVHLSIILLAAREGKKISELATSLPKRYTASDRLMNFPQEKSNSIMALFNTGDETEDKSRATEIFGNLCGSCCSIDRTDGLRMTFDSDEVIHLRASGNAPEFRCYNESVTEERVVTLNAASMEILKALKISSEN